MSRVLAYDVTLRLNYSHELLCQEHYDRHNAGGYLAGQAFTEWTCTYCKQHYMHHNTAHPQACLNCALRRQVCQRCLQPTDMITITEVHK